MTYTPEQRRAILHELIARDGELHRLETEFWQEKEKYQRLADRLPRFLRDRLYGYPTMCYLYHQQVISFLLENLRFPEEA